MKYKSKNLDFLSKDMKLSKLCYHNDHYYFQSESEIVDTEIVSDEEFAEAMASIVVTEPTSPEPSQLDRIESTLALLTVDTVTEKSISTAIMEGVNEV